MELGWSKEKEPGDRPRITKVFRSQREPKPSGIGTQVGTYLG